MKTFVLALAIGIPPCTSFAQTEYGTETGANKEEVALANSRSAESLSDANLAFNVIPPSYANVNGGVTFTGPLSATPRTCQFLIHDTLLTALVGRRLTAVSWRLPASATSAWPTADVTCANYDVYLSGSVAPANRSLTFAQNIVGVQTQVRAESLVITTGSYASGGNPNAFGPEIRFTPWLYTDGHLLIEIRHPGFTGTSRAVDAISTSASGYGTEFSSCWQSSYTSTTGLQANFCVLRLTADSTAVSVGEDGPLAPQAFALHQNYPNPFNPVTNFKFSIVNSQLTILKVYDLLGREVTTLVNELKLPGSYQVSWDAGGITSGVYFYRLQAGNFVDVKKLMLLK